MLVGDAATRRYRTGYRFGGGSVAAVARPGSLVEFWRLLRWATAAGAAIIVQAANTGLTGGSTPNGDDYDRPVLIISTGRLRGIQLIEDGGQVLCLPGATLDALEAALAPIGREPHSVIGSSCIGASVIGGVCNNSGGALVRRGPAYTELALFAQQDAAGELRLVNHLGLSLGGEPEEVLRRLEAGDYTVKPADGRRASDHDYAQHVRAIDAATPARFNADARRLHEASGSAGKLAVFAVRLDTFPRPKREAVFYIGSNDPADLAAIRRDILGGFRSLPVAAEYIHRTAFDIARDYGRDTFIAIRRLGTRRLPRLFAVKARVDAVAERMGAKPGLSDRLLQRVGRRLPDHLPRRMIAFRDRYEHHLLLRMADEGVAEAERYLAGRFPSATGDAFACTPDEGAQAFLHRFVVAGAAVRYRAVHPQAVEDIVALDIALPRNARDWFETLPAELDAAILHKLYYGHFLCHVLHQDYVVAKGHDPIALEHQMWALLDARGAEYPAEHNVGHLYPAKPALADFYRGLDLRNTFNPGVGQMSKRRDWC